MMENKKLTKSTLQKEPESNTQCTLINWILNMDS